MSTQPTPGRVAVIRGASSGIGEATARTLAADGYHVALLARRADRIQALADELGRGALAIEADVTDRDSLVAAARRVQDELGRVDVLVDNADVMLLAPFTSDQRSEQRRMVATEVFLDRLRDGGGDRGQHLLGRRAHRPPDDVAQIIAFAVSRPRGVSLNEILVRPTAQA
jgi:NADP-dependent 3-hydroxy acid dehydrogenase YdfG